MTTEQVDLVLHAIAVVRDDIAELKAEVEEVKREAKKTNGRLRVLELWRAGVQAVTNANAWVRPAVVGVLTGVVLAVLTFYLHQ